MRTSLLKPVMVLLIFTLYLSTAFAQSPQKMSYQAVIRNSSEALLQNQAIGIKISILQGSENGTAVYVETQNPTTNANGLVSLEIGSGTVQSGNLATIDWASGPFYLKTETDPTGGINYTLSGNSQLLSVPFALHANEVDPSVPQGTQAGEMQYWNGSEWVLIDAGNEGDIMTLVNNTPTWSAGSQLPGAYTALAATNITEESFEAHWTTSQGATTYYLDVNTSQNFTGTWIYNNHDVGNNTGYTVSGLTCGSSYSYRLRAGNSHGTTVNSNVISLETSACSGVGAVENPATGKTWMDRNLGASRVATSSTDASAYGDLYQWGRAGDGHEKRNSATTSNKSDSDTPGHGNFIAINSIPYDWRSPQNDNLWQGLNGINNPCPEGYRLPTEAEWQAERQSWSSNNAAGAFGSPLKLPVAGFRFYSDGFVYSEGTYSNFWSSTLGGTESRILYFDDSSSGVSSNVRAYGLSVRCIKD